MEVFKSSFPFFSDLADASVKAGFQRIALVGGAVRDLLLLNGSISPSIELKDFDFVIEGDVFSFCLSLVEQFGSDRVSCISHYSNFQTVSLNFDGFPLDIAMSRMETYSLPAHNPTIQPGSLDADLLRRDFTINAIAFDIVYGNIIDLYNGMEDLANSRLVFLHPHSVRDDPTRVVRASRYAARFGFVLSTDSQHQLTTTIHQWPWDWTHEDNPELAPPALSSRLRMELDRLFVNEPWSVALNLLEDWQAMTLFDPSLQIDPGRNRRIAWAKRLGLPLLPAWLAVVPDPQAVARRLNVPAQHERWLKQLVRLREWLLSVDAPDVHAAPDVWTVALEIQGWMPETVAFMVCLQPQQWKPLLRWWGRWRHLKSPKCASDLIADGWSSGPALGTELQRLRLEALKQGR